MIPSINKTLQVGALLPVIFGSFAIQAADFPVANTDAYTAVSGQSITVQPLANDTGDSIFIEAVNSPSPYGTGTTTFTGSRITYTAPAGFVGTTEFWYGIKDADGNITSAPITVTVSAETTAVPQAVADFAETTSGQAITVDVLANDTGNGLFIEEVDSPAPFGTGTSAIINNKVVYTPPANFVGSTSFFYGIKDSAGQITSAELSITVAATEVTSPWPTAGDDRATTASGEAITIDPLWNDTGTSLEITEVNAYSTLGSTVSIVDNKLFYTPSESAKGEDVFWYQITDSLGRTNAAPVTVVVEHAEVNLGSWPTGGSDSYTVNQDSADNVFDVFANDTGSGLTVLELFEYTQKGGRVYDAGSNFTYTAPTGFTGTDEFWYAFTDAYGRSNAAKVTIEVVAVETGPNNAPNAVEDGLSGIVNASEAALDVLANDTDADGDALSVIEVGDARFGSVRLVNGVVLYTPPATPQSDAFSYTISDGRGGTDSAVATISVTDPSDDNFSFPVITGEFVTVAPGATVIIRVLDNDTDADGDTLILDEVTSGGQGSTVKVEDTNGNLVWVEYTALSTATGTDEFYYGVHDGRGKNGSGRVAITFE
ncbi:Ig-like domain-containing protein [Leucothrix arctica]|nr:Ig-like domain-containing protein [Leucothrix arctica]